MLNRPPTLAGSLHRSTSRERGRRCLGLLLGAASLIFSPLLSAQQDETITREVRPFVPVTDEMLRDPDPGDWLMTHRTYDFQAYSPLDEIDRDNVHTLQVAWMRAMDEGPQQTQPLVYDGVMYL
ncbi:MAG: hypothetical protein OXG72_17845, partial [Acidobacteria bacterium]|nr:hypothetical protein [Acidobacteriota bacterium]